MASALNFPIPPMSISDYTQALRAATMDDPELNHILLDIEDGSNLDFKERDLEMAVYRALGDVNTFPPVTPYTLGTFPSITHWTMLLDLSIIRLLESKSVLRIRNEMAYQDNGGVSVDMRGKAEQYQAFLHNLYSRVQEQLRLFKHEISVRQGYGEIPSPYGYSNFGW